MEKRATELAVIAHGQYSRELSPLYTQMREALLAELALKYTDIATLRGEHESTSDNGSLILELVKDLPGSIKIDLDNLILENDRFDELLLQRSASFFYEQNFSSGPTSYSSYYLVGFDSSRERILASPMRDETSNEIKPPAHLVVFAPSVEYQSRRSRQKQDAETFLQDETNKLLTDVEGYTALSRIQPDELAEQLFDKNRGKFVLRASSPESKKLHNVESRGNIIRTFSAGFTSEVVRYLTDEHMAQFDVPSHLSRLATMFNKNDELTSLLHGKSEPANPHVSEIGSVTEE